MSRITPITPKQIKAFQQVVRGISSSNSAARPSALLDSVARANVYLPRSLKDLKTECNKRQLKAHGSKSELVERLAAHDHITMQGLHTSSGIRPQPLPARTAYRTIPLMQGFRTSALKQAAHDTSTIDYAFFPPLEDEPDDNPFSKLRVPLLPDNYAPDRSAGSVSALETLDEAVPSSEISVLAGHPEQVLAAMSEVVGNEGLDVDIGQLTSVFSTMTENAESKEIGLLQELWNSFMDDVFSPKGGDRKALA